MSAASHSSLTLMSLMFFVPSREISALVSSVFVRRTRRSGESVFPRGDEFLWEGVSAWEMPSLFGVLFMDVCSFMKKMKIIDKTIKNVDYSTDVQNVMLEHFFRIYYNEEK